MSRERQVGGCYGWVSVCALCGKVHGWALRRNGVESAVEVRVTYCCPSCKVELGMHRADFFTRVLYSLNNKKPLNAGLRGINPATTKAACSELLYALPVLWSLLSMALYRQEF